MRTTLAIEDDVFDYVRQQARQEGVSIGHALSRLAKLGIQAQNSAVLPGQPVQLKSAFSLLPQRDERITNEHVRSLLDAEAY